MGKPCTQDGCDKPRWARGYCLNHDKQYNSYKYEIKKKGVSVDGATPKIIKRSFIKPISSKQASKLAEYRVVRDKFLKENPVCQVEGCTSKEVELHHKKPRAYFLCDITVFMSVCRKHHLQIEQADSWARNNGYKLNHL